MRLWSSLLSVRHFFLILSLFLWCAGSAAQNGAALFTNTPVIGSGGSDGDSAKADAVGSPRLDFSTSLAESEVTGTRHNWNALELRAVPDPYIAVQPPPEKPKFKTRAALRQSFEYLMLQHAFRVANDPSLRFTLAHSTFFHNWFASYKGYDLKRWGDGDDFIVNDIGHPLQGAVASRIFLQNSPTGTSANTIGKDPKYWTSRLKGMAWAAAFEVQWKIGPLSETTLGNAGGWLYVPGCGFSVECAHNPKYRKAPTNNTGLSDWILTPVIGTGWVMAEDTIEKYIVRKVEVSHAIIGGRILRTALEPSRSFAGLFMGKLPWQWPDPEMHMVKPVKPPTDSEINEQNAWKVNRRSIGIHYANLNVPALHSDCIGCRSYNAGIGVNYGYRILRYMYFDSDLNYFGGGSDGGPTLEALFGAKIGHQGKNWGVFGKVRPGLIYYEKAWTGGENAKFDSVNRFVWDTGGVFEVYPSRRSTFRLDIGSTIVRYKRDYPNPTLSPLGSFQSSDYYVNQGNFQIASGYTVRF